MRTRTWKVLSPMVKAANWPMVALSSDRLFCIGGMPSIMAIQIYHIKTDKWTCGTDMPRHCDSTKAGVVVLDGIIHAVCHTYCLTYNCNTNTWTTMVYDRIGRYISQPVLYQGLLTVFCVNSENGVRLMSLDVNKSSWSEKKKLNVDATSFYISPWNYLIKPFLCVKFPVM